MDLTSPVEELSLVGPIYKKKLEKLEISSIEDLLLHVPNRYDDYSFVSLISRVQIGVPLTIRGKIESLKNQYTRAGKKIQIGEVSDSSGKITVVWFNQPFLIRTLFPGQEVSISGKANFFGNKIAIISPEYEVMVEGKKTLHTGRIVPVYHETAGISSKWLRRRIKEAFDLYENKIEEFLPDAIIKRLNLMGLVQSIKLVHFPNSLDEARKARVRLAFDELFYLQLGNIYRKLDWQKNNLSYQFNIDKPSIEKYINSLPFSLTSSQGRTTNEILGDLEKTYPMNRLLEGDVGSGKTVVASIASFVAFLNGYQSIFMAPTQILANQHYDTLNNLFKNFKIRVSLITSEQKKVNLGKTDIFVGTHSLIYNKVPFDKAGLVVIDEQHRFGVEQRSLLVKTSRNKSFAPHVLTMTATPIPRTVALTFYGDLDLSTLDELPSGRQKIKTWVVPPTKREDAYGWIASQIKAGSQAFVVCPLIEESDKETMKDVRAVTTEYTRLKKIFKNNRLGLLHGRLKAKDKNFVLESFRKGEIDILVATPVVEVGIDIPNATIMLIEAAERFGLAQLHQLRGRVGRGEKKSYCLLFSEATNQKSLTRLNAMTKTVSGFELAELDLELRGPGEVFGTAQSGFPELKIASWNDFDLIKKAKDVATEAVSYPSKYGKLQFLLKKRQFNPN